MNKLTVIAGPANSGKTPYAQYLANTTGRPLIHRDQLRTLLYCHTLEEHLTQLQADLAKGLLANGYSPIVVGQNQGSGTEGSFSSSQLRGLPPGNGSHSPGGDPLSPPPIPPVYPGPLR